MMKKKMMRMIKRIPQMKVQRNRKRHDLRRKQEVIRKFRKKNLRK